MNCRTCAGPCCLKGSNHEGDCEGYKPMSHYDQIRSMSVEEMAHFLEMEAGRFVSFYPTPAKCWLDWLNLEAEEGET